MSLEVIKKEMSDLLENVDFDCQAAEAHATGANIHEIRACSFFLRDLRFALLNDHFAEAHPDWEKKEFQWLLVSAKKLLCKMNLLRIGNDCRTAEREAKKLFNPGKFPGKEE